MMFESCRFCSWCDEGFSQLTNMLMQLLGYKMHRRTKGLTEFDFQKEGSIKKSEAELFSTVCISGWLRDSRDFQRPVSHLVVFHHNLR